MRDLIIYKSQYLLVSGNISKKILVIAKTLYVPSTVKLLKHILINLHNNFKREVLILTSFYR